MKDIKLDISISLVNYNSSDLIKKAIDSIIQYTKDVTFEIIISNNSPEDVGYYSLKGDYSSERIILIDNKDNLGFSKANNNAFQLASGKYFLIMNPDLFLHENSLKHCFTFLEQDNNYRAVTIRFNYPNGDFQPSAFFKQTGSSMFYSSIPYINYFLQSSNQAMPSASTPIVDVQVLCGAFIFIHYKTYKEIDGFDEDFFLYGEDWEISNRIRKEGLMGLLNSTSVIHLHGGASNREFNDSNTDLNLETRKGTQMFVSILLWQKKEFGNMIMIKLYFLILFSLILSFCIIPFKENRIKRYNSWKKFLFNFFRISINVFYILFNIKRVYRTM